MVRLNTPKDLGFIFLDDHGFSLGPAANFSFRVQANNDAHVALSTAPHVNFNTYEIVIGMAS